MLLSIFLPLLVASLVQAAPTDTDPLPYKGPGVYYTKGNGTVEDLLQELLERNSPETVNNDQEEKTGERYTRAQSYSCSATPVYGLSTAGSVFVDFTSSNPWPCGVDIAHINLRHGGGLDSIQVTYKTYDGKTIVGPKHGGNGGTETIIAFDLENNERIVTVAGTVKQFTVQQITFVTLKNSGELQIYGPYGGGCSGQCDTVMFLVHGKINSIFGRADAYVRAIGFYFEEEGVRTN